MCARLLQQLPHRCLQLLCLLLAGVGRQGHHGQQRHVLTQLGHHNQVVLGWAVRGQEVEAGGGAVLQAAAGEAPVAAGA